MRNKTWNYLRNFFVLLFSALLLGAGLFAFDTPVTAQAQGATQLRLLESSTHRIVVELQVDGYQSTVQTQGGSRYTVLSIDGLGHSDDKGKPQLPVKSAMIGIPPGAQASLRVIADDSRRDSITTPVLPGATAHLQYDPRRPSIPRVTGTRYSPDTFIYSANQFFPADAVRLASTGNWRSQRYAQIDFYPLQYNPIARQVIFHRRLRVEITLTYPRGASPATLGSVVNEGTFESVLQNAVLNYSSAKNWRAPATSAPAAGAPTARAPRYTGGPWYKIAVNADGIYQITCADLAAVGLTVSDPTTLQMFKHITREVAINVVGAWGSPCASSSYLEFFGQAASSRYTDTNIYWLTYGNATGIRMPTHTGVGTTIPLTFTNSVHAEQNLTQYLPWMAEVEYADHWFWRYFYVPVASSLTLGHSVSVGNLSAGTSNATMQVALAAGILSAPDHHVRVSVNGNIVTDTIPWSGSVPYTLSLTFPASYLTSSTNVDVNVINDINTETDIVASNYIDLNYPRNFTATTDVLRFRMDSGAWQFQIPGFTSAALLSFDITDPYSVTQMTTSTISGGPPYTLQVLDTIAEPHEYLALTTAQRKSPVSITLDTLSNLRDTANQADYIIIAHKNFIVPKLTELATFRTAPGRTVKIVDVQDVYDEFSDGLMDAQAIRDFLSYAYNFWASPKPYYVLLVGNGNVDFKNYYSTSPVSYIPPYERMVDPWQGETASDHCFVTFPDCAGRILPSMAIGRLPADSVADVNTMINKILGNEQALPSGTWRSQVTFVADNTYDVNGKKDDAGNFWDYSESVADNSYYLPSGLIRERIYFNPCPLVTCTLPFPSYASDVDAHNAVLAAINQGRLLINYVGHSGYTQWADYQTLFLDTDVPGLTNGNKLPVFLDMTCLTGKFDFPNLVPLQAATVKKSDGGALAAWAPTGLGVAQGHDYLDRGFFEAAMRLGIRQLGPATMHAQYFLWANAGGSHRDLLDTYVLFGDPASTLQIQFTYFLPFIAR